MFAGWWRHVANAKSAALQTRALASPLGAEANRRVGVFVLARMKAAPHRNRQQGAAKQHHKDGHRVVADLALRLGAAGVDGALHIDSLA